MPIRLSTPAHGDGLDGPAFEVSGPLPIPAPRRPHGTPPEIVTEARSSRHDRMPAWPPPGPAAREPRRWTRRLLAGAAGPLMALGALASAVALLAGRERVVRAVPPSAAIFAGLGLPVDLLGLRLAEIHGSVGPAGEGAGEVLTLDGRISNVKRASTTVPKLRVAIRDKSHNELYSWVVAAPRSRLQPLETIVFHNRLDAPPPGGHDVVVGFAGDEPTSQDGR